MSFIAEGKIIRHVFMLSAGADPQDDSPFAWHCVSWYKTSIKNQNGGIHGNTWEVLAFVTPCKNGISLQTLRPYYTISAKVRPWCNCCEYNRCRNLSKKCNLFPKFSDIPTHKYSLSHYIYYEACVWTLYSPRMQEFNTPWLTKLSLFIPTSGSWIVSNKPTQLYQYALIYLKNSILYL